MTANRDILSLPPRQRELLERLQGQAFVRVRDLAEILRVDPMTIRRDLNRLHALGLLERLHGGCRLSVRGAFDRAFAERERLHRRAKKSIGERAAALVEPGQLVLIDTGSTPLAVAQALSHRRLTDVTIVTSSLPVLWELYDAPHLRVIALGGDLQRETGQLYGPLTENILASLIVDIAFMGADGIDAERGFAATTPEAARLASAMWKTARRCIVVADGSKIGAYAPFVYAPLAGSRLITDRLTPEQREELQASGLTWEEVEQNR